MGQGVTPPQPKPEAPLEKGRSPSAEPAIVSARDGTKRVRTPRVLTTVDIRGEALHRSGYREVVPG